MSSRTRLREALKNVAYKSEIIPAHNVEEVLENFKKGQVTTAVFINSALGFQKIADFAKAVREDEADTKPLVIVCLRAEHQENGLVASLYLEGVNGFICEPFSVDNLRDLINTAKESSSKGSTSEAKLESASDFLIGGVIEQFDVVSKQQKQTQRHGGYAFKTLQRLSESMKEIYEKIPEKFQEIMLSRFEKVEAPKNSGEVHIVRQKVEDAPHPGKIIGELIAQRGLDLDFLTASIRISKEDFEKILAGTQDLTEQSAREISRGFGRTNQYWVGLQKKFNEQRAAKEKKE